MTKRERVIAAIERRNKTSVPSSFSLHFPKEIAYGDAAVEAHLNFFNQSDADVLKIMNENLVPSVGPIKSAADFDRVGRISVHDKFMQDQLELTKKILDRCDPSAFTTGTLHGMTASTLHPIEYSGVPYETAREQLCQFLREDSAKVSAAMHRICDAMCDLARKSIELGLDSIYYASLGGEPAYFTDEEFAEYIAPLDKQIMTAIREAGGYCILHVCKENLNMNRYASYGPFADIVNWGVYEAPMSLEDGRKMFPNCTILGGMQHRGGVLETGTPEQIQAEVRQIIDRFGPEGFILGADCTLSTDQRMENVRAAVYTARNYSVSPT